MKRITKTVDIEIILKLELIIFFVRFANIYNVNIYIVIPTKPEIVK